MSVLCRLCQSNALKPRLVYPEMVLSRCTACGFEQIDPQPSAEQLRLIYDTAYFGKAKYGDPVALGREYERRRALIASAGIVFGAKVLEIGCGVGS